MAVRVEGKDKTKKKKHDTVRKFAEKASDVGSRERRGEILLKGEGERK